MDLLKPLLDGAGDGEAAGERPARGPSERRPTGASAERITSAP